MPQENQQAIQNIQNWLNRTYPPAAWVPIDGFNAIVKLEYGLGGNVTFNTNVGFPLKGFVNTQTGEVKIFDGRIFLRYERY